MTTARRSRRTRALIALAAGAMVLGGCAVRSPVQTDHDYAAADGVNVDLGPVKLRNLLLVADEAGGQARLAGIAVNDGNSASTIQFQVANAAPASVSVPPRSTYSISESQAMISPLPKDPKGIPYRAGSVIPMTIAPAGAATGVASVPVLPATGVYEELKPSAAPASS